MTRKSALYLWLLPETVAVSDPKISNGELALYPNTFLLPYFNVALNIQNVVMFSTFTVLQLTMRTGHGRSLISTV